MHFFICVVNMDTFRLKVIKIILQYFLLKHIIHLLFVTIISFIFKKHFANSCGTFVHITVVWTLSCIFSEESSNSFIYKTCYIIGMVILCFSSLIVIQRMFTLARKYFVNKYYTPEHWPVALYLISIFFAQDYGLNFILMIPFHFSMLFLILTHVNTRDKFCGMKGFILLISITVASNKWREQYILLEMCLVMAETLEDIHRISIFLFETFLPRLYAIPLKNIKLVLDVDLVYVIRVIEKGENYHKERGLISTVYTNLFVDEKSGLHISYKYGQTIKVSEYAYRLLTGNPYEDPNYCDRHGQCPLWYITEKCCYYSSCGSRHLTGHNRPVSRIMFQKILMLEFIINVQAGFRIFKCAKVILYCLRNAIHKVNKTRVLLFLHEAGILINFYNLRGAQSDKWEKFMYPLSLKRLCGNVIRVTLRRNAYLGVKHLCNQGYLPITGNFREFITLGDVFSNFRELADYVVH